MTAHDFQPNGMGGGTLRLLGVGFPETMSVPALAIMSSDDRPPLPFGDGLLCLSPPIVRLATRPAVDGKVEYVLSHNAGPGHFYYQLWFRNNPIGFCDPSAGWNLSNVTSVVWH